MRVRAHSTWIPQRESFPMWWFWMQNKHLSSNQCTHIIAIVVHLSEARERLSANVCAFRNYKCVECLVRSFQPKKHIDFLRWNLLLRWLCSIRLFCTRRTDCVRERERDCLSMWLMILSTKRGLFTKLEIIWIPCTRNQFHLKWIDSWNNETSALCKHAP